MFIQNLDKTQQQILLSLADKIIMADGRVDERETIIREEIKKQCIFPEIEPLDIETDRLKEFFNLRKAAMSLFIELMGVAYADEELHEREKVILRNVAEELNIDDGLWFEVENWVKRQMLLTKEAVYLMEV